jgi:transcriptional regulator with XRE-family HTH domain
MADVELQETIEVRGRVLGLLLRQAREQAGKTVRDVADALGCSSARIKAYELGERSPTLPEIELAAYYLQVPLSYFFDEHALGRGRQPVGDPQGVVAVRQRIVGALLQQARVAAHRTLRDVSREVGITRHRLRQVELGDRPVPLPLLEALANELGIELDYFRDGTPDDIAEWDAAASDFAGFQRLPADVRRFVLMQANVGYLQVAMHLSQMSAERLRAIAEGLLDITY